MRFQKLDQKKDISNCLDHIEEQINEKDHKFKNITSFTKNKSRK